VVLILVALIALSGGCVSPAEQLDKSVVQQVHAGEDRSEVRKLLGSPNWVRRSANGETADTYIYSEAVFSTSSAASSARDLKARAFSIRYDTAGRAYETLLYESLTPALVYRSSAYAGPTVTAEALSQIRTGVTTREELERKFQKPLVVNLHPERWLELHWYQIEVDTTVTHFGDERGLHILVDDQGIVRDVTFSDTADRQR
jgi:outer membrane protein assembly factor BamE (lipoprotein component of BamABCDE complex)